MEITSLHAWDLSPAQAIELQRQLAPRVVRAGVLPEADVRLVAGADVAFERGHGRAVGVVVLLSYPDLTVVERVAIETPVRFPYVPGLLSFRETPVLIEAFARLSRRPDLLLVDGHGYAHPRRFGFACHLGLLLNLPTIGVAKSRLIGEAGTVAGPRGSRADLRDGDEVVGSLLRTRQGVRSIFVSVGQRISLADAEVWALRCARGARVPEPTRLADLAAGEAKRRMLAATVEVVVEQRAGEAGRWEWDADRDEVLFQRDGPAMPLHYGCAPSAPNPADNEWLDVALVDSTPRERAERVWARVVDVLQRTDGDDKLLAVPVDAPLDEGAIADARQRLWDWSRMHRKPVVGFGGEDAALRVLEACGGGAAPAG